MIFNIGLINDHWINKKNSKNRDKISLDDCFY